MTVQAHEQIFELLAILCQFEKELDGMTPIDRIRAVNNIASEIEVLAQLVKEEPKEQTKLPEGE